MYIYYYQQWNFKSTYVTFKWTKFLTKILTVKNTAMYDFLFLVLMFFFFQIWYSGVV